MNDHHYPIEQLRIISLIHQSGNVTTKLICERLSKNPHTVRELLQRLKDQNCVQKPSWALWSLTDRGRLAAERFPVPITTAVDDLLGFFKANPDEELTTTDIEQKFAIDVIDEAARLRAARTAGKLQRVGHLWVAGPKLKEAA
ncbi:hypothetical protein [Caldimonas brevitalea]|uniref:MarR family transcriptional regulator n=1 Tax=Caldimonas brevitalea TaxID=413882 RepID=A0A0G3BLF4_9BURK|nr:hypothetical protein [Caldimonas brevitalea]AKJ28788.1 hypothetical protein AAW51_2097 [Caldimonas brevitalea]